MTIAVRSSHADAGATITHDLDAGAQAMGWTMLECPLCGRTFSGEVRACTEDGSSLRSLETSLPFIWIG